MNFLYAKKAPLYKCGCLNQSSVHPIDCIVDPLQSILYTLFKKLETARILYYCEVVEFKSRCVDIIYICGLLLKKFVMNGPGQKLSHKSLTTSVNLHIKLVLAILVHSVISVDMSQFINNPSISAVDEKMDKNTNSL